jgi:hypothetical protein
VTTRARLAAAAAAAALAACTSSTTTNPGALLADPISIAVFRGVTVKAPQKPGDVYRPFIAVANAASNELSIVDGVDDTLVQSPALTRGLVYPAPGRPVLLAAGDLGDGEPDLLAIVTAGDLPSEGGLRVVETWNTFGLIASRANGAPVVDFGADVQELLALPFDPAAPGSVTLVAILAGGQNSGGVVDKGRIATVTFRRAAGTSPRAIDLESAQATVKIGDPLSFRPLALAAIPGERNRVFVASADPLPPNGVEGVAEFEFDVTGTLRHTGALNARAPTRLVTAVHLAGGVANLWSGAGTETPRDATAFATPPTAADRVLAVLDESGCGFDAEIACGLVALDPATGELIPDPASIGSAMHAPFAAPIPLAWPLAVAAGRPPANPPSAASTDAQYAGAYERIATDHSVWTTSGVAAVASTEGYLYFVDVARWMVPSDQPVAPGAKVSSVRPSGTPGAQWLTLVDPSSGATIAHNANELATAVKMTAGYTPNDQWTVTRQGALPRLSRQRAESFGDGSIALQVTSGGKPQSVVTLWDPVLGVTTGDVVVIEASGLGTCPSSFEAAVAELREPRPPEAPGGSLVLAHRTPAVGEKVAARDLGNWAYCVDLLASTRNVGQTGPSLVATVRAAEYVLVRGTGSSAVHVGRPALGERFEVKWQDEGALAAACTLPPAKAWPGTGPCAIGSACRASCEALVRARLARRVGYVEDPGGDGIRGPAIAGPAIAFTLGLELPRSDVPRDLALFINTSEGRAPARAGPSAGSPVAPRQVLPFDRSPWTPGAGVRYLVPYAGGTILDATPSLGGSAGIATIH